jgi:RNA binding exosome subunit
MATPSPKVRFRTFVHATEDEQKVSRALVFAMACDDEPEGLSRIDPTDFKGHHGNPTRILEARLGKQKDVRRFFDRLRAVDGLADRLLDELDERLDEDHVFHFRLDKQEAVMGRLALTRSSDAIQVEVPVPRLPGRDPRRVLLSLLGGASSRGGPINV